MKLTMNWLRDFVDLPTEDPEALREVLDNLGYEVEEMAPIVSSFSGVVIGRVESIAPHPDADRIRVCQVDVGSEVLEIICGAWNFEAGAIVPVAVPGAVLGGGFEITRRKIRGVVSNGMICSEQELELGEDAEGIMVLDTDYPDAADALGAEFATLLAYPDTYLDIDINPNRPDTMSVLGLARELAAYYEIPLRSPEVRLAPEPPPSSITVEIADVEACPRFAAREVRQITVGPSPHWLRARLIAAGVRPINNVVDASNYAMIEIGHPTHAFDADRLGDRIVVRRAEPGEHITTLDGVDRALLPTDIVVTDGEGPVAIGGVMGGADTEVHEGTTRVLVEAAYWDPPSIMFTSKRLGLRSEASARFERGMDPNFCAVAADRVAQLLVETAGGTAVAGRIDAYPAVIEPRRLALESAEVLRVLGTAVPTETVTGILNRTGFGVAGTYPMEVTVPTRRPDVIRPVDLIEDVARFYGYDNFPDRVATGLGGGLPPAERQLRKVRSLLTGAGYSETLLFSFMGSGDLDAMGIPEDDPRRDAVAVVRPINDDEGLLRTTLLPGLLKAAAVNVGRHLSGARLFEIGSVFAKGDDKLPFQPQHLAVVATGEPDSSWLGTSDGPDVYDGIGLVEMLVDSMRATDVSLITAAAPGFHPGRCADIVVADQVVGVIGEVLPSVAEAFGLKGRVVAGEMALDLFVRELAPWQFDPPSSYPPAIFDLAFEVGEDVAAATVLAAIEAAAGDVLERSDLFDVFVGDPIPEGRKSLAVRLTLRAPDRTLRDEEVGPIRRAVVERVTADTGAALRGEV